MPIDVNSIAVVVDSVVSVALVNARDVAEAVVAAVVPVAVVVVMIGLLNPALARWCSRNDKHANKKATKDGTKCRREKDVVVIEAAVVVVVVIVVIVPVSSTDGCCCGGGNRPSPNPKKYKAGKSWRVLGVLGPQGQISGAVEGCHPIPPI
jgi:hypothetical protein